MVNDVYELLLAARRYHRFGDPRDAVDVAFLSVFLAADLLMNALPVPKAGVAAARGVRRSLGAALGRIRRLQLTPQSQFSGAVSAASLKSLERFGIKGVPEGSVALKGPGNKGVYVKNGESFVADDTHHYPVYRRENEQWLRLKNAQSPGENELILQIHQPREWLLGADAPQPGPSSGVLNPWRAPRSPSPDWQPPRQYAQTEALIRGSSTTSSHWHAWRTQIRADEQWSAPTLGVVRLTSASQGTARDVLRIGMNYGSVLDPRTRFYRLLSPGDHAPLNRIAFITREEPMAMSARSTLERWTSTALDEQPMPVSHTPAGEWQVHAPLFNRPLEVPAAGFPSHDSQQPQVCRCQND
ncbi:hypothetical protein [Pseudomonas lactucae]|nr:hypothetical protein [Pseudomonas lactucae]